MYMQLHYCVQSPLQLKDKIGHLPIYMYSQTSSCDHLFSVTFPNVSKSNHYTMYLEPVVSDHLS